MNDAPIGRMTGERKERRGFASMTPEKQGTAHEWTSEEARSAGRKGGQISRGGRGRLADEQSSETTEQSSETPVMAGGFDGSGTF